MKNEFYTNISDVRWVRCGIVIAKSPWSIRKKKKIEWENDVLKNLVTLSFIFCWFSLFHVKIISYDFATTFQKKKKNSHLPDDGILNEELMVAGNMDWYIDEQEGSNNELQRKWLQIWTCLFKIINLMLIVETKTLYSIRWWTWPKRPYYLKPLWWQHCSRMRIRIDNF